MRYNPPPNWPPPPPGWAPPPGWQPDPSWGPPPPGWPLWVPGGTPQHGRNGLIIGGIVAAGALVAIIAVVLVVVFSRESPPSDEEQIRAVISRAEKAWNDYDFAAFGEITCKKDLQSESFSRSNFEEARDEDGRVEISVKSIDIEGDTATVRVEERYENNDEPNTVPLDMVKEDGSWKACDI